MARSLHGGARAHAKRRIREHRRRARWKRINERRLRTLQAEVSHSTAHRELDDCTS